MPRTSKEYDTRTRTARIGKKSDGSFRLPPRTEAYYRSAGVGKLLGYKRLNAEANGAWLVRTREAGRYAQRVIGQADDFTQADGGDVLTYEQALRFVVSPTGVRKSAGLITVADAMKTYYDTMKSKHREAYRAVGKLHIIPELGGYRVDKLTRNRIDTWLLSLVREDTADDPDASRKSKDTANRILSHLKAALNLAFDDESNGIASDNAWRRVKSFEAVSKSRDDHALESKQVQRLIAKAATFRPQLANLISAGFLTGARLGELCDATAGDFDQARGILRVSGKTGARPIILTDETTAFFAKVVSDRTVYASGLPRNSLLFADQHGKRWPTGIQFGRQMRRAVELAGLPYGVGGVTFYTLRHAYISRALENGIDATVIARNCGTSVKMIEQHYEHIFADRSRAMLERGGTSLRIVSGGKRKAA